MEEGEEREGLMEGDKNVISIAVCLEVSEESSFEKSTFKSFQRFNL